MFLFFRRASQVVSPSELPDSPGGTTPHSPSAARRKQRGAASTAPNDSQQQQRQPEARTESLTPPLPHPDDVSGAQSTPGQQYEQAASVPASIDTQTTVSNLLGLSGMFGSLSGLASLQGPEVESSVTQPYAQRLLSRYGQSGNQPTYNTHQYHQSQPTNHTPQHNQTPNQNAHYYQLPNYAAQYNQLTNQMAQFNLMPNQTHPYNQNTQLTQLANQVPFSQYNPAVTHQQPYSIPKSSESLPPQTSMTSSTVTANQVTVPISSSQSAVSSISTSTTNTTNAMSSTTSQSTAAIADAVTTKAAATPPTPAAEPEIPKPEPTRTDVTDPKAKLPTAVTKVDQFLCETMRTYNVEGRCLSVCLLNE